MDLGPAREPIESNLHTLPEVTWIEPIPTARRAGRRPGRRRGRARDDPARVRRRAPAPAAAPARRADPLRGAALAGDRGRRAARDERRVGEQRAPARAGDARGERASARPTPRRARRADRELLARYVEAFERYDMDALTSLIHEDATQSMPPFDLWLSGRDDIFTWWFGPGIGCRGSRVMPTVAANGSPAFGQYKPSETGDGYEPWALQVLELAGRPDRRAHVLPRHRDALPALRPAALASLESRSTSSRPTKATQLAQLAARRRAAGSGSRRAARRAGAARARRRRRRRRRPRRRRSARSAPCRSRRDPRTEPVDRPATARKLIGTATDEFATRRGRSRRVR